MKKLFFSIFVLLLAIPVVTRAQMDKTNSTTREYIYELVPEVPDVPKEPKQKKIVWYHGEASIGYGFGSYSYGTDSNHDVYIETVQGIHITKYLSMGFGVQMLNLITSSYDVYFPVFFDLKGYYPLNQKYAPFIHFDVGMVPNETDYYLSYGVGLQYKKHWKIALTIKDSGFFQTYGVKIGYCF